MTRIHTRHRDRVFLLTDAKTSARIKSVEVEDFEGIPVDAQIWDLSRLYEVCTSPDIENIEIDFRDFVDYGIPCIEANVGEKQKYRSYLGVIPGELLADIYDKYGAKLLEGNVRSFLSTKVAVNKKIRETIINSPQMFFAFNNMSMLVHFSQDNVFVNARYMEMGGISI